MHKFYNINTNAEISIPSDIEELSPEQYVKYLELIYSAETGNMPIRELRVSILEIVCPVSFGFRYVKMSRNEKEDMWSGIYRLSEMMDSFFDVEESGDKRIYKAHLKSGSNLLPEWNGLRGPDDMLNNITWGDFTSCLNLINSYKDACDQEDHKEADNVLAELFYTLYKSETGQKDQQIPNYVKLHALTFFTYVFELISTVPIPIHGSEIDFRILFTSKVSASKDNKMGWNGLVFSVAESGVFGKTAEVNNENFWSVLLYLYKCTFDNLNIKKP